MQSGRRQCQHIKLKSSKAIEERQIVAYDPNMSFPRWVGLCVKSIYSAAEKDDTNAEGADMRREYNTCLSQKALYPTSFKYRIEFKVPFFIYITYMSTMSAMIAVYAPVYTLFIIQ